MQQATAEPAEPGTALLRARRGFLRGGGLYRGAILGFMRLKC
jgi:hypothetical protein